MEAAGIMNSEFLMGLFFECGKTMNIADFIDCKNEGTTRACVAVSMGIAQNYEGIRDSFENYDQFISLFTTVYFEGIENYNQIVHTGQNAGKNINREITFEEALFFYPMELNTVHCKNLISNNDSKNQFYGDLLDIKQKNSYMIVLRDSVAFVVISVSPDTDEYIVIDPHVSTTGILTTDLVYRFVTFDGIWDETIYIMTPKQEPITLGTNSYPDQNALMFSSAKSSPMKETMDKVLDELKQQF
jgi:hypothetical protein